MIKATVGVVEHGLFLGLAVLALIAHDDGSVERVSRRPVSVRGSVVG